MRSSLIAASAAAVLMAPALTAQGKPTADPKVSIPESAWPPDGMCRVWLRDVPERQQPAPSDCVTALRTRPRDATLLLGRPVDNARAKQDIRAAARTQGGDSLFDDRAMRGLGFRPIDPRRIPIGAFKSTARPDAPTADPRAEATKAAGSKAPATKVIKRPEP